MFASQWFLTLFTAKFSLHVVFGIFCFVNFSHYNALKKEGFCLRFPDQPWQRVPTIIFFCRISGKQPFLSYLSYLRGKEDLFTQSWLFYGKTRLFLPTNLLNKKEKIFPPTYPSFFGHKKYNILSTCSQVHMFASQWFLTLFTAKFPLHVVFGILDLFLSEGHQVIFSVALALLKISRYVLFQQKKIIQKKCMLVSEKVSFSFAICFLFPNNKILDFLCKKAFLSRKRAFGSSKNGT